MGRHNQERATRLLVDKGTILGSEEWLASSVCGAFGEPATMRNFKVGWRAMSTAERLRDQGRKQAVGRQQGDDKAPSFSGVSHVTQGPIAPRPLFAPCSFTPIYQLLQQQSEVKTERL